MITTTKPRSQFALLPEQDRTLILKLCGEHSYDDVVAILAKPRKDGGLNIGTSKAALCRFFSTHNLENSQTVLAQVAAAANIRHEQNSTSFLGAICASIEARVYENLLRGKALADMEKEFRFLKTAENLYLAKAKFNADHTKSATHPAYQALVDRAAKDSDVDFTPIEPDAQNSTSANQINDFSDFDREVQETRKRAQQKAAKEEQIRLALEALNSAREQSSQAPQPASAKSPVSTPAIPAAPTIPITPAAPSQSAANTQKSPAIPHIPLNSTSAKPPVAEVPPAPQAPAATAANPGPVRFPFVRLEPKISRNAPCPCGSGLKYKKCCLNAKPDQKLAA